MEFIITHPFLSLIAAGAIVTAVLAGLVRILFRRWNAVFGKGAKTPGDALQEVSRRLVRAESRLDALEPRVDGFETIGKVAVQRVGFKRFNPFDGVGGDQSFAVALLDHQADGIIISSLYTRDGVRVYAKKIEAGASKHPLSREEQEVLAQALTEKIPSTKHQFPN